MMTGTLGTLVPIILMFAVLYFLLIRPQQKQQKAVRQMQEELKKGDSVVTIGDCTVLLTLSTKAKS